MRITKSKSIDVGIGEVFKNEKTDNPKLISDSKLWLDPQTELLEVKYLQTGKVFQYEHVEEIIVLLCFEDDVAPGQAWIDTFRAQYKETEIPT